MEGCSAGRLQAAGAKSVIGPFHPCRNVAHQSDSLHNARIPLSFHPLVTMTPRRKHRLFIWTETRPQEFCSISRRRTIPVCAASQVPAPAVVRSDGENAESQASASLLEFASSLASAVEAETAADSPPPEKKKKRRNRQGERTVYLLAAVAGSVGFTTLAAGAVYYRFAYQLQDGPEVPYAEMLGTFSLAIGASVGMEFWARWAHKALWHASLWNMHESHHKPREGPFELNDVFAITNAVPAIALMAYGFFHTGFLPGLCFGAGLGITMFGMAYMFVHDGLVHKRFPVGPIADVPYLQKVAAAHQLHHADLFGGVPYGLFLGPKELEDVGGEEELQKVMTSRSKVREGERQRS